MTAFINGVMITGTPDEIRELMTQYGLGPKIITTVSINPDIPHKESTEDYYPQHQPPLITYVHHTHYCQEAPRLGAGG